MTNLIIACLLSGVASLLIGFIWYHPKVFGTAWMKETGLTPEDAQKGNMPMVFGISFLVCAYLAYEMKWINHEDELPSIVHGFYHGARHVGLFAVGALIVNGLFEQKGLKYFLVNGGYWLMVFGVIGAILASFPSFKPAEEAATEGEDTGMLIELNDMNTFSQINGITEDTYYLVG